MADCGGEFRIRDGSGPIVAAAIHGGHLVRPGAEAHMALDAESRLREEDPYTMRWAGIGDTQIVAFRSRFEVDLNRPRNRAVYREPSDSWGLRVWRDECPADELAASLEEYDDFYAAVGRCIDRLLAAHERLVVIDLHSYNHRRDGPGRPEADHEGNPDINVGTETLTDPMSWRPVIDGFILDLSRFDFEGRHLDVRENVKFKGGQFGQWLHDRYPGRICCLSVEVKKIFMDEWTGQLNRRVHSLVFAALSSTVPRLRQALTASPAAEDRDG